MAARTRREDTSSFFIGVDRSTLRVVFAGLDLGQDCGFWAEVFAHLFEEDGGTAFFFFDLGLRGEGA